MANQDPVYTGNTISLAVDCEITTTSASRAYLYVRKPDGTEATWTAAAASTTFLVYTTTATDLNIKGLYDINAYIQDTTSTTWNFTGRTFQLRVWDKYEG